MKTLLAVDDDNDITFTLKVMLQQCGFSIDVFNEPHVALKKFKPNYYDLILLDVKMPQMNGFELYQEINKIDKNTRVCFLTAFVNSDIFVLG